VKPMDFVQLLEVGRRIRGRGDEKRAQKRRRSNNSSTGK